MVESGWAAACCCDEDGSDATGSAVGPDKAASPLVGGGPDRLAAAPEVVSDPERKLIPFVHVLVSPAVINSPVEFDDKLVGNEELTH